MKNNQLLYISGSGRSGSTLLDMLLSRHSLISALGEVHRLYVDLRVDTDAHKCTCGERVDECHFWKEVNKALIEMKLDLYGDGLSNLLTTDPNNIYIPDDKTGLNIEEEILSHKLKIKLPYVLSILGSRFLYDLTAKKISAVGLVKRIAHDSHLLYDAVRKSTGKPVVVDSTKTPLRLKTLYMERPHEFKVLHLVRDGRAVAFARVGRQGIGMDQAAKIWRAEQVKLKAVFMTIPKSKILQIKYEDLCTNPEGELQKICDFLNVGFEKDVLGFNKQTTHGLGGNPMRWRRNETEIVLNEKWKSQISAEQLREFERVSGRLNRAFGYVDYV